jgi:hypothetical protein
MPEVGDEDSKPSHSASFETIFKLITFAFKSLRTNGDEYLSLGERISCYRSLYEIYYVVPYNKVPLTKTRNFRLRSP